MAVEVVNPDKRYAEIIKKFANDRIGYVKHILGATPTDQQGDGLKAMDENDFVAIKSGVGTGKSTVMSWDIHHYTRCRPFSKTIATSPSKDQLRTVLWPELLMWHNKSVPVVRDMFEWRKESYVHKEHENWFAVARTASKENAQAMAGIHAKYVNRLIDEGSQVPEEVYEVLEGDTGLIETLELRCGNPTSLTGSFYDAFNKDSAHFKTITWNSLDSPLRPERVIERIRKKFGENSNMWRVRVLGEFPLRDGDSYIPFDWAVSAVGREIASQKDQPIVFGIDVARYGDDDTVIAIRQGDDILPYHVLRGKSTMETANYIAKLSNIMKPTAIFVDVIGLGAGVFDRLEELGYPAFAVNVSESPANDTRYRRLRDELWGNMRDWLEMRRGRMWDNEDKDLIGELTTPRYKIVGKGVLQVESKDEMKKRGVASPNIADATNLLFAQPVASYRAETHEEDDDFEDAYVPMDAEAGY